MTKQHAHILFLTALLVFGAARMSFASSTGSSDDRLDKFSLKNLSKYSRSYSISGLRPSGLTFSGTQELTSQKLDNNQIQTNSVIRLERGNTTYVYPYKYKVKVPKFKTPTTPTFR
ncbi:hypothetical protein SAMN05421788_104132 [Filimonas lacunae]|uniref:Uncharacterized protein n=1 Tax=Filimonas lacunae TaxID=477680 RepID=A0A173M9B3_9BACT|nr:hypothetical protein [Filimonas lacunae]BAV04134.1 hypothetical protein FLA_0113 [Filimonas lacunae]SIT15114.1 hypothetical protein SAMN05421788_104132 [Filimonas lacunae]